MLELNMIKKDYPAGDGTVHALKGVSLRFRESEFVSVLGPSGCGKTTMLNIIGGLDKYTSGDLIINGKSTKDFKDRDWDTYRNHSIGFVFQSYHLIPHQTVLQNVELALTLSGVSKSERRERAIQALKEVGLETQLKKRPAEMSGGQMQRVAIARALVNDPDIIFADEPTGALDTETSIQVMDILKKISEKRLIIMVTHNPELAEKYSTRIIRMLDGEILSDSMPLTANEIAEAKKADEEKAKKQGKERKPSMKFATAFGLSLKNLFTKKGRTILTSFAGSIGIIGIALIFAVSRGMTSYINTVQEDTLSSYPLTIEATHTDMSALLSTFVDTAKSIDEHENDAVYSKSAAFEMMNALNSMESEENDLSKFKDFIETEKNAPESALSEALSGVKYTYDQDMLIYTESVDGSIIRSDMTEVMKDVLIESIGSNAAVLAGSSGSSSSSPMSAMGGRMVLWQEMLEGDNGKLVSPLLEKQYDVIYGSWPTAYDQIVLVVDDKNELSDMTLYALGLKSKEEMTSIMKAAFNGEQVDTSIERWTYEEICGMDFRTILNSDCYTLDEETGLYTDLRDSDAGMRYLYDNGLKLKVVGIIRPNPDAASAMLSGSIAYTTDLTKYVIEHAGSSDAVTAQKNDPHRDIFTGLKFNENNDTLSEAEKADLFRSYVNELDEQKKADAYVSIMSIPSEEQINAALQQTMAAVTQEQMKETVAKAFVQQTGMSEAEIAGYIATMSDEEITGYFTQMMTEQIKMQTAEKVQQQMEAMTPAELSTALEQALKGYSDEQCAAYFDEVVKFSDSTYEENLKKLGCIDINSPSSISLYASSFENKDVIVDAIAEYNKTVDEFSEIKYTDFAGIMMSSVTMIINAISYVLISFVAISLVVSSIMIGVITLISVQERTKEIGILRAIGASKKNVSSMFNAETVIIGFTSGLLGVLVTYLLCVPINAIIHRLTGIGGLNAFLPLPVAVTLIIISMLLTLVAGIIPSRSAAKKDPVVALRTE